MDIDFALATTDREKVFATWTDALHVPRVGDCVSLDLREFQVVQVYWDTMRSVTIVVRPA